MTSERNRSGGGGRRVDWEIAGAAEGRHGVVSLGGLREAGLGARGASHRAAAGKLHRLHRGTYGVGHTAVGDSGRLIAAALACGEGAAISHGTAAKFWELRDWRPHMIDVIVPCEAGRKLDGIRPHRCRYPDPEELTVHRGVPCTTPSRTIDDMAGLLRIEPLRRLVEQAAVLKLLDIDALDAAIHRAKGRRGIPTLRTVLDPWRTPNGKVPDVRSVFEARLLPQIVAGGLPRPLCNQIKLLEGQRFELDFLWEEQRLVVETDGKGSHQNPVAFVRDRHRDQVLITAGYRVPRLTYEQVTEQADATVARIRRLIEEPGPGPTRP